MNVVFLSPAFPPTAPAFCAALAKEGVKVLGIGDQELSPQLQRACGLTHYVFEPRMAEFQPLLDATEALARTFGRIDRIDSNGEHWLACEARLRDELGVPGLSSETLRQQISASTTGVASPAQWLSTIPPTPLPQPTSTARVAVALKLCTARAKR